jgi:hypothetical protein
VKSFPTTATDTPVPRFPELAYTQTEPDKVPLLTVVTAAANPNVERVPNPN